MTEDQARQRVIRSMCPEKVCRVCGEPSRRIVERDRVLVGGIAESDNMRQLAAHGRTLDNYASHGETTTTTLGWSDCGHDDWRPGVWLNPFAAGEISVEK